MRTMSFHTNKQLLEQPVGRFNMPLPIVYEDIPAEPVHWEYHILTIDVRERGLPDATRLNQLGQEGWLLVGIVDQGATGRSSLIHYYFARRTAQAQQ